MKNIYRKLGLCLAILLVANQLLTGFASPAKTKASSSTDGDQRAKIEVVHEDGSEILPTNPVKEGMNLQGKVHLKLESRKKNDQKKLVLPLPKEVVAVAGKFKAGSSGEGHISEHEITVEFPNKATASEEVAFQFNFKLDKKVFDKEKVELTFFDEVTLSLPLKNTTVAEKAKVEKERDAAGGATGVKPIIKETTRGIGTQAASDITEHIDFWIENIYINNGGSEREYIVQDRVTVVPQPEVMKTDKIYYNFGFKMDMDKHIIETGDYIVFELPDTLTFPQQGNDNMPIVAQGVTIGRAYYESSGGKSKIKLIFNNKASGWTGLNDGYLNVNGRFDEDGAPVEGGTNQIGSVPIIVGDNKPGLPGSGDPDENSPVVKNGRSDGDRNLYWDFDLFFDSYYTSFKNGTTPERKQDVIFEDQLNPDLDFLSIGAPVMYVYASDEHGVMKEDGYLGILPFESNGLEYFRKLVQGGSESNEDFEARIKAETNVPCYGVTDKYVYGGNKLIINFGEVPNSDVSDLSKGFVLAGDPLETVKKLVNEAKTSGKINQTEADKTIAAYTKLFTNQEKGVYGIHFSIKTQTDVMNTTIRNEAMIDWENKDGVSKSDTVEVFVPEFGGGVDPVLRGTVYLEKKDHETDKGLANVSFSVQKKAMSGQYRDFATVNTDSNGKLTMPDVEPGDYRIKEIDNPNTGYQTKITFEPDDGVDDEEWYHFKILSSNQGGTRDQRIELLAYNYRSEGSLVLTKKNQAETELLDGAKFTLHKVSDDSELESGFEFETGKCYKYTYDKTEKKYHFQEDTGSTAETGKLKITGLPLDTYYLIETQAPPGHMLSDNPAENKITGNPLTTHDQVLELTMKNKPAIGSIKLFKKEKNSVTALPNAKFVLYKKDSGGTPSYYKRNGTTVEWVTNKADADRLTTDSPDGKILVSDLTEGTYFFQEVEAPPGYQLDDTEREIDLTKTTIVEGTTPSITVENEPTTIEVVKKDANTGDLLSGASFQLYNESDQVLDEHYEPGGSAKSYTTNAQGKITFNKIPDGKYYLQETQAPTGYELSDEKHRFEVKDGNLVGGEQLTIENTRKGHLPGTGSPWGGVLNIIGYTIIALGAIGMISLWYRRVIGGMTS